MKVFSIAGKIGVGKDTVGNLLRDYYGEKAVIIPMSGPLRDYARNYFGWDGREETKPRSLLQRLGTEIIREKLHKETFLVDRIKDDIEILSEFYEVFIITGVRRVEEIEFLKSNFNATSILVKRDINYDNLSDYERNHYTEHALDNYNDYDYLIDNLNIDEINEKIKEIVSDIK